MNKFIINLYINYKFLIQKYNYKKNKINTNILIQFFVHGEIKLWNNFLQSKEFESSNVLMGVIYIFYYGNLSYFKFIMVLIDIFGGSMLLNGLSI